MKLNEQSEGFYYWMKHLADTDNTSNNRNTTNKPICSLMGLSFEPLYCQIFNYPTPIYIITITGIQ